VEHRSKGRSHAKSAVFHSFDARIARDEWNQRSILPLEFTRPARISSNRERMHRLIKYVRKLRYPDCSAGIYQPVALRISKVWPWKVSGDIDRSQRRVPIRDGKGGTSTLRSDAARLTLEAMPSLLDDLTAIPVLLFPSPGGSHIHSCGSPVAPMDASGCSGTESSSPGNAVIEEQEASRFHSLRHRLAHAPAEHGKCDLALIQSLLGHTHQQTTTPRLRPHHQACPRSHRRIALKRC